MTANEYVASPLPAFGEAYQEALSELGEKERRDLGNSLADRGFRTSYGEGLKTEQSTGAGSLVSFFMWLPMDLQPKARRP